MLKEYIDHRESKSEGNIGLLSRKHLSINGLSIHYIGKESNELSESGIIGVESSKYTEFIDMETMIIKLLSRSCKEAQKIGISKTHYYEILNNYKQSKRIKLKPKNLEKIVTLMIDIK